MPAIGENQIPNGKGSDLRTTGPPIENIPLVAGKFEEGGVKEEVGEVAKHKAETDKSEGEDVAAKAAEIKAEKGG